MATTYNLDPNFIVDILTKIDYKEVEPINHNINFHTEAPSLMTTGLEQVCFFKFFYREAETVDPRSGQPVSQGDSLKSFARFWG